MSKTKSEASASLTYKDTFPIAGSARTDGGDIWITLSSGAKKQVTATHGQVIKYLQSPSGRFVAYQEHLGTKPGFEKGYKGASLPDVKVIVIKIIDLNTGDILGDVKGWYFSNLVDDVYYEGWTNENELKITQVGPGGVISDYTYDPASRELKTLEVD
ncbi:MAG TPA: hypothetical protein VNJ01_18110 [Bacteriovoracaceae bacterium]|nr:hypothetical protein [Bacteriovoracaceae bacterium]